MSSNNINQILSRNLNVLEATTPLFINISADGFIQEYASEYSTADITCFNTHFEDYVKYKQLSSISSVFTAQYRSDIKHDLVVISFPKSKAELNFTLAMISHATTENTNIIIVGDNKSGIKTLAKVAKDSLKGCNKIDSARHCLMFVAQLTSSNVTFNLDDWFEFYSVSINDIQLEIAALPGVFSQKGLDKGTKILLENLPDLTGNDILDFGCGAGVIASFIGKRYPDIALNLLDVSALAIASSQKTLTLNGLSGHVFASNSLSNVTEQYHNVISNPPFHQGVSTNYHATESFLKGIKKHLSPSGQVIVVANSFLQYEPIMKSAIGTTQKLTTQQGFTIYKSCV